MVHLWSNMSQLIFVRPHIGAVSAKWFWSEDIFFIMKTRNNFRAKTFGHFRLKSGKWSVPEKRIIFGDLHKHYNKIWGNPEKLYWNPSQNLREKLVILDYCRTKKYNDPHFPILFGINWVFLLLFQAGILFEHALYKGNGLSIGVGFIRPPPWNNTGNNIRRENNTCTKKIRWAKNLDYVLWRNNAHRHSQCSPEAKFLQLFRMLKIEQNRTDIIFLRIELQKCVSFHFSHCRR